MLRCLSFPSVSQRNNRNTSDNRCDSNNISRRPSSKESPPCRCQRGQDSWSSTVDHHRPHHPLPPLFLPPSVSCAPTTTAVTPPPPNAIQSVIGQGDATVLQQQHITSKTTLPPPLPPPFSAKSCSLWDSESCRNPDLPSSQLPCIAANSSAVDLSSTDSPPAQQPSSNPISDLPCVVALRSRCQKGHLVDDIDDDDTGTVDELSIRRHTIADMTVAAYGMVICGTDDMHQRYRGRIEKVKFGVPVAEAFSHDIPATLLVLLLKVNKEGPLKKDIWRAPGNQAQVRKLSHIMQNGRLVNISNISVYTAASVIKKFLSKLPGGIFGNENEQELFSIVQQPDSEQQRQVFCRVICSLSLPCQHLLVLLFGTFRIISDSSDTFGTRMTPDAIGISVAPSLFHTCIHDGQRAKLEDVMRFKLASQVISKIIQGFGYTNLFPRECYEFYARITGRTLRVDEHWHFTFQYPSSMRHHTHVSPTTSKIVSSASGLSGILSAIAVANKSSAISHGPGRSYSLDALQSERDDSLSNGSLCSLVVKRDGTSLGASSVNLDVDNAGGGIDRLLHIDDGTLCFGPRLQQARASRRGGDRARVVCCRPPPPPPRHSSSHKQAPNNFAYSSPPQFDENRPHHPNTAEHIILKAIDDLNLRESASCNF